MAKEKIRKKTKTSKVGNKLAEHAHEHEYWSYPPELPLRPGEHGLPEHAPDNPGDINIESVCGGIDDSQPVEQYDGSLGVLARLAENRRSRHRHRFHLG